MWSEVKPQFGFGSYPHITVYIHNKPPHSVHILIDIRISTIHIYIYTYMYKYMYMYMCIGTNKRKAVVQLHLMME